MNVNINEGWKTHLETEFEKDYFKNLVEFVKNLLFHFKKSHHTLQSQRMLYSKNNEM